MENTSLGFHTISIVKKLTQKEAKELLNDFYIYKEKTNEIRIFPICKAKVTDNSDEFIKWLYSSSPQYYKVYYPNQSKGILWLLRIANKAPGFIKPGEDDRPCSIKVTINPKILASENNYLAAATAAYLDKVTSSFNIEARKISPILGDYRQFSLNRPDYCINFDLKGMEIPCTAEQMIYLIKHGDIPKHYSERMEYNNISKRKISCKDSFYLESRAVTINCYRKEAQLRKEFQQCPSLEASQNIIRFEVQCKYQKTYLLSKNIKDKQDISEFDVISEMLSDDFCADIIRDYFYRIVRRGDYFTLDGAIRRVQSKSYKQKKEERLISELQRISRCRGIHKVRAMLQGEELAAFRRTLNDLEEININPVTIPREWNISRIPNLLYTYDKIANAEQCEILLNEQRQELIHCFS